MDVRFSKRAGKFINKNGAERIFVSLIDLEIADSLGATKDVHVGFEEPDDLEQFSVHRVEGIDVYVDKALKVIGPVIIKRQGLWKFSSLYADGLQVPI